MRRSYPLVAGSGLILRVAWGQMGMIVVGFWFFFLKTINLFLERGKGERGKHQSV